MIKSMPLTGMTKQLAINCQLKSLEEGTCVLLLSADCTNLRVDRMVKNLEKAVSDHLGKPVKLIIEVEGTNRTIDTPAAQDNREREARQQAAELELEQDPTIKAFREQLGARIVPGSARPLD